MYTDDGRNHRYFKTGEQPEGFTAVEVDDYDKPVLEKKAKPLMVIK